MNAQISIDLDVSIRRTTQHTQPPPSNLYRVRKWGDPIITKEAQRSTDFLGGIPSNFQAIPIYNKANDSINGISNWLRIEHGDIMRLSVMQVEDEYQDKIENWRDQKMRWLLKQSGTIYFGDDADKWATVPSAKWGTIALGNNLVAVEGVETIIVKTPDGLRRSRQMAKLKGFRKTDWNKPLADLLAAGLVHRCYCAYSGNDIGDTPKGIIYSPFWSPLDWDFVGTVQPEAFYLPLEWLIKA
jgi:hypothetical protein